MNSVKFTNLCEKAFFGKREKVLIALNKNPMLITRTDGSGNTLLHYVCMNSSNSVLLVKALLSRRANVHTRNVNGINPLMFASRNVDDLTCALLLDAGADPNSNNKNSSALSTAAINDRLDICLLLISRGANLMLVVNDGNALDIYGKNKYTKLTSCELDQRRATLRSVFIDYNWTRRWPMMNVMTSYGFRPLHDKLILLQIESIALSGKLPSPIVLDSPEKRRVYYMGLIFACDGLLRQIVAFL